MRNIFSLTLATLAAISVAQQISDELLRFTPPSDCTKMELRCANGSSTTDHSDKIWEWLKNSIRLPSTYSASNATGASLSSSNQGDVGATPVLGTWIKKSAVHPAFGDSSSWGVNGYSINEYQFFPDNTFYFYSKTFGDRHNELLLIRESGAFTISGSTLTLTPHESSIESWTKKDGTDKWGTLVKKEPRKLESSTYTFNRQYFTGTKEWVLILQTKEPTERDGAFTANEIFKNAYYYAPPSATNTPFDLPRN